MQRLRGLASRQSLIALYLVPVVVLSGAAAMDVGFPVLRTLLGSPCPLHESVPGLKLLAFSTVYYSFMRLAVVGWLRTPKPRPPHVETAFALALLSAIILLLFVLIAPALQIN